MYERLTEEWMCRMGMWSLVAPLINFSTEKCPVQSVQNVTLRFVTIS